MSGGSHVEFELTRLALEALEATSGSHVEFELTRLALEALEATSGVTGRQIDDAL